MATEALPFVSIVIPVLDGETMIDRCLTAVLNVDYPAEQREIVVVDNGSRDRTAEIVERYPVTLLHEPRRGSAAARNRGIEAARGDVVACTDADCLPTTVWLRELVKPFARAEVGGVAGEIVAFPPQTAAERHAARIRHLSPERYLQRPILPFAVTANLAFRRNVFERVGLLDPKIPRGGESTDFCTRFRRATDLLLEFAPKAIVLHRHRTSTRSLFVQNWFYGRGHAYLYGKYRDELPWGWAQRRQVYADLASTAGKAAWQGLRYAARRSDRDELEFWYFELVRKVAERLGFVRETMRRANG